MSLRPGERGHVLARPGDPRTLCGRRRGDVAVTWARFVADHLHVDWCDECLAGMADPEVAQASLFDVSPRRGIETVRIRGDFL